MISLTQQFEFSAAHRLHCDRLSDEENRALFGKCNNPEGHGHNYVVEVTVDGGVDPNGQLVDLHAFEAAVKRAVVDRLDHKHLNRDIEDFTKTNPTVENIAIAIWHWLDEEFKQSLGGVRLTAVRVYETPKTWAEYRG
jgi:6-pyruvoyltetrahydropterin/6-carboxytetrahydropterin synthase